MPLDDETIKKLAAYIAAKKELRRYRARKTFLFHALAYLLGNAFLGAWNAVAYFIKGDQTLWFIMPLVFWGIGLGIHYVISILLFEEWWRLDDKYIAQRYQG